MTTPSQLLRRAALSLAAAAATLPAHAGTQLGEYFTFSGFGTLGLVATDSNEGQFVRATQFKGATKDASALVDSNLGLQLTGKANDWLSGTLQLLSAQRQAQTQIKTELEWAFVKVAPMEGLAVRVGRMPLATFAVSDSRNIGYANTWVRPPNEVYALSVLKGLRGGDLSYRLPLGSSSLTASAAVGKTKVDPVGVELDLDDVRNLSLTWEADGITARVSRLKARVLLASRGQPDDFYTFTGAGLTYDRDDLLVQAEYVTRRSSHQSAAVDADGWYVMGGYRLGAWMPYVSYAKAKSDQLTPFSLTGKQTTLALGARWDVLSSAAVKFQFERINTHGSHGASFYTGLNFMPGVPVPAHPPVTQPVNALSVAVDFVF